jgi:hypothetical protein
MAVCACGSMRDLDAPPHRVLEPGGAPLKTVRLREVEQVDGIWTARRIEAENLQTGHRTVLRFEEIDHRSEVPEALFTEASMRRGAP